ncbi:hypothetical protein [Tuwongella immobilis]|uniref:Uncharacterized protein n=1 Tax=Tuwongella immobilis TaxID=692036 RepID=A0A6C2YT52_9BACT|nr:hypothetical protein [Tuwongella immobilis]VIP04062.1 unnamed protein product [Tuwongella immobilis]VTS05491.1 unnamed protein product [Tuwongella immobilis]
MAWPNFSRKPQSGPIRTGEPTGLDLTASSARAVAGRLPQLRPLLLDDSHDDLPLAINLERRVPEVGRSALALSRKMPHFCCQGFLGQLGDPTEWRAGKVRFDALGALQLVFEKLQPHLEVATQLAIALPVYLTNVQVEMLTTVATRAKLSINGTITWPLALLASAPTVQAESPLLSSRHARVEMTAERGMMPGRMLLVDVDDCAMSFVLLQVERDEATLLGHLHLPALSKRVWIDRMLNSLADRCIRVCRRDPREDANAEQLLVDQFDEKLDQVRQGNRVCLTVRSERWYQDLIYQPEEMDGTCPGLQTHAVDSVRDLLQSSSGRGAVHSIWMTHAAGRLPGLATALLHRLAPEAECRWMPAHAVARSTCLLLEAWRSGQLPRTHVDRTIRLIGS